MKIPGTIAALLLVAVAAIFDHVDGADADCPAEENPASSDSPPTSSCSVYYYEDWLIAGRDYARHAPVGWNDVQVPWIQHDRRAWPMFGRFHFVLPDDDQHDDKPFHFVLDPARGFPLLCHGHFNNLVSNNDATTPATATPWKARVRIKAGDPLFVPCRYPELEQNVNEADIADIDMDTVMTKGLCLDHLQVHASSLGGQGVFAQRGFGKDEVILPSVPMLHLHRSELQRANGTYEDLLRYCYGHANTHLLLLPQFPVINALNHDRVQPNVAIRKPRHPSKMVRWKLPAHMAFGQQEQPILHAQYVALRDICAGEELVLDYGFDVAGESEPREIQLPDDFFPAKWLRAQSWDDPLPVIDTKPLKVGEIDYVRSVNQYDNNRPPLHPGLHRIGLPIGFTDKLLTWAEDLGLVEVLRDFILRHPLKPNGKARVRLNGGTWWITRFESFWTSNMHYITPDDDESHEQYMKALGEAGFDLVLESMGPYFGVEKLTCFYPSLIAVSHAMGSNMHSDSDHEKIWNVIFPLVQSVNGTKDSEINLGDSEYFESPLSAVPFRYDTRHAVILGKDGIHGTAPTDYRNDEIRIVASVYMGDFDDSFVDEYVDEDWADPPYPMDYLRDALMHRIHWSVSDPDKTCGAPQVNDFTPFH